MSNSYGIQTFVRVSGRIQNLTLREAIKELDDLFVGDYRSVVVFSNGISSNRLKRLITLRHLGLDNFDWRREKRLRVSNDRIREWKVDKYLREADFGNILIISDSRWENHPVSYTLSQKILNADIVIEICRPRQTWLNCIAHAVEESASVSELISLIKILELDDEGEDYQPFCGEYQYLDVAFRTLLSKEMLDAYERGEISAETWNFILHRVLGLPIDVSLKGAASNP